MSVYRIRSSVEDRFTRHLIVIQGTFEKSRGKVTNVLMAGPTRVEVSTSSRICFFLFPLLSGYSTFRGLCQAAGGALVSTPQPEPGFLGICLSRSFHHSRVSITWCYSQENIIVKQAR